MSDPTVTLAADVATIKAAILLPDCPYSALDLAMAIVREHELEPKRMELIDVDDNDIGWWTVDIHVEGRDRVQVCGDADGWNVYSDIEHDGDLSAARARSAAAALIRAADLADELNQKVAA